MPKRYLKVSKLQKFRKTGARAKVLWWMKNSWTFLFSAQLPPKLERARRQGGWWLRGMEWQGLKEHKTNSIPPKQTPNVAPCLAPDSMKTCLKFLFVGERTTKEYIMLYRCYDEKFQHIPLHSLEPDSPRNIIYRLGRWMCQPPATTIYPLLSSLPSP